MNINVNKNKYSDDASKWIMKKINQGVHPNELLNSVGLFSNKQKKKVMAEKGLDALQYDERYKFLGEVYNQLSNGTYMQKKTASTNVQAVKNNINYNANVSNGNSYYNSNNKKYYNKPQKVTLPSWWDDYNKELDERLARMQNYNYGSPEEEAALWEEARKLFGI